ncbi:MAG: ABC transporter ATP-binding protein [Candidatus Dormibacteraeota bacterium]|nr:ABC transporter ATP-binding protein [Candidatus Dormibacteraeota bacterium]
MQQGPIVEARGLTKRYGSGVLAVDRLDLSVRHGEVYGFLGPNGAGKTSTLRMLVGLIRPTAGAATVAGFPPGAPQGLARIGSLVEAPAFYPYLSGRDNLRFLARLNRLPDRRVESALDQVGLLARGGDRFQTYSMGMRQRLGVAAALLKEPDLLVLDEPSNGLDPEGMIEMRELIRSLGQGERTVLLSSHLLNEVELICSRLGVIQGGRMVAEGTLEELRGSAGLVLRAEPEAQAREFLVRMLGAQAVAEQEGLLRLSVDPSRAGEINTALVQAGMVVSELRPRERSLEEVFLQLTQEPAAS